MWKRGEIRLYFNKNIFALIFGTGPNISEYFNKNIFALILGTGPNISEYFRIFQ